MAIVKNHLIELLPRRDRARLLAVCEPFAPLLADVLCEPGQVTRHVYFPLQGFISLVQGEGSAWRVAAPAFRAELARSPALQRSLNRYLYVLMAQQASSAACLRFHLIGPRLARWLLMSQDRAHSDSFHVTHRFLAYMVGVRREGITAAAGALQRDGLISCHRGDLVVLDRAGLEAAACGCYAAGKHAYAIVMH